MDDRPASAPPALLMIELALLYVGLPLALFAVGTRAGIFAALWGGAAYAAIGLSARPGFSWRALWHGRPWPTKDRTRALMRFGVLALAILGATLVLAPDRFLGLPREHPGFWLVIMVLYPLLSIVPQELVYRSFFFERYARLVPMNAAGILVNGLLFGFSHLVLNNWVAPTFSAVGGVLFAHSYSQHRALKWVIAEHAAYGCWIFTVGLGWFFFSGNWHR